MILEGGWEGGERTFRGSAWVFLEARKLERPGLTALSQAASHTEGDGLEALVLRSTPWGLPGHAEGSQTAPSDL